MAAAKSTLNTPVQKNITARHRAYCGLAEGKKRCTCSPAYLVRVGVGSRAKQKRVTRTFSDLVDAQRWLLEHSYSGGSSDDVSLAGLLTRFRTDLEGGKARDKQGKIYKPSTAREYVNSIDLLVDGYAEILRRPVDTILRSDLQQIVNGLAESRGPQRVRNMFNPVRIVLSEAARDGLIRSNPTSDLRFPAKIKSERILVDFESDEAMVDRLSAPLQVLYGLAFYAGLRRGEAMGLRWKNVNLEEAVLRVEETFTHDAFTDPKSSAGRREIPIPSKLTLILRDWQADCERRGPSYVEGHALVLAGDSSPERPIAVSTIRRMVQKQGAPPRIHPLRHSYATMLERAGVPLKEAQLLLGHADAMTTANIYQHASTGMMERVRDKLEAGFGENTRLSYEYAEVEAWELWQETLDDENEQGAAYAEVQGGGFTPRDAPLFDM
jgi:integrase